MKKYIFILLAITVFSSCTREERGRPTQRGHEICGAWNSAVNVILAQNVNPAFCLNAWIISDEAERYIIEDRYFPQYKIRQLDATTYCLYSGSEAYYTINTHGTHITDESAVWTVTTHFEYGYGYVDFLNSHGDRTVNITNLGNDQWSIALDSASFPQSTAHWTLALERFTNHCNIFTEEFTLSGDGVFAFSVGTEWEIFYEPTDEPVMLSYAIERPLKNEANDMNEVTWKDGKLDISISHSNYENVDVTMEIHALSYFGITYKGVTEIWFEIGNGMPLDYYE